MCAVAHLHTETCAYVYVRVHTHIHTHTPVHSRKHFLVLKMYALSCTHTYAYVRRNTSIHTCIHAVLHASEGRRFLAQNKLRFFYHHKPSYHPRIIHTRMHTYIHTMTRVHTHTHTFEWCRSTDICVTKTRLLVLRKQDYTRIMTGEDPKAINERVKLLRTCEAFGFMRTTELLMMAEVAHVMEVCIHSISIQHM
jgi:hypothetical protein